MKKGVSFFSFAQDVNIREAAQEAQNAGYDGVEPVLTDAGSLNMAATEREFCEIRRIVNDLGLEIPSVGAWNLWSHNLASDDPKERQVASDIVKKQIDCAAAFGADTVLVVPGWVGAPFAEGVVPYDRAYENAQRALLKLAPYAQIAGVSIAVENVWNKFLLSPLEMRRFLDEIASPFVGAYFDVGNIVYIGYPDQWIEILGHRIKKLHFCDYRADQAGLNAFVDLLAGDVDYAQVMRAIRAIGYDDYVTVEFLPNYRVFPYQSIRNARLSLDTILAIQTHEG